MNINDPKLRNLIDRIGAFDKENLVDILHLLTVAVRAIAPSWDCRVYLEDLTQGALTCAVATGPHTEHKRQHAVQINAPERLISQVYLRQKEQVFQQFEATEEDCFGTFGVTSGVLLPILLRGRSVGVLCLDSTVGASLVEDRLTVLRELLAEIAGAVDQARQYHQQIQLSRQVDRAKKREAAFLMVRSAVELVDKVALASVLIPTPAITDEDPGGVEILASFSREKEAKRLYEDDKKINLGTGKSLLSPYIDRNGRLIGDNLSTPLFIPDLTAVQLQKRYLTEQMGLKSLYVVPRIEPGTRRVVCLVHYYTSETYEFSPFEKGLLEAHAEVAQRVVQEIGDEHIEVQVLSEINDLLAQRDEGLSSFLHRVLSKATELIGADAGSIALVEEMKGERWLVVEDEEGRIVGAKNKEWLKKNVPLLKVGGEELPARQRSLTGYVAHSGKPTILSDVAEAPAGFHRDVAEGSRSEIAVPLIAEDEVIAVICLNSLRLHYFSNEHQRILQIISRLIARHIADLQRIEKLTNEVSRLRTDVTYKDPSVQSYKLGNIIGNSPAAGRIVAFIQRVTPPLCHRLTQWHSHRPMETTLGLPSLLITGSTGAGKEFFFNNLFSSLNEAYRAKGGNGELPVKKTNIAAYSGDLTYSELFGHKRGAFTGASNDRRGILEEADGGVVFLDEIGDADPKTQVQLLRFLDNGEFVRLGENITRYTRCVLVAATNKDLRQRIADGKFREDLYHRLSELSVEVPNLNQRREDIPDLAVHFLGKLFRAYHPQDDGHWPVLTPEAKELLSGHHYQGNIRELRSILLRALLFAPDRTLGEDVIQAALDQSPAPAAGDKKYPAASEAQELLARLDERDGDFWSVLYEPYSDRRLNRETVQEVIRLARSQGDSSMPKLARRLHACDPASDDAEEKKVFFRFKNFLYKTIRIQ